MYQILEEVPKDFRPGDAVGVEDKSSGHAQQAQLIDGKEHFPEVVAAARFTNGGGMLHIVILRQGKDDHTEQEVLHCADDLRVGKALLVIENKGADTA